MEKNKIEEKIYDENIMLYYPHSFRILVGENRIIVAPMLRLVCGLDGLTDVCSVIDSFIEYEMIGNAVYDMRSVIISNKWRYNHVALKGKMAFEINTQYKTETTMYKHNILMGLENNESGKWVLYRFDKKHNSKQYDSEVTFVSEFDHDPDPYTLGKAIMDAYEEGFVLKKNPVVKKPKENVLTLTDGRNLRYIVPNEDIFIDLGDAGAVECYQAYAIGDMDEPDGYLVIESLADFEEDMSKEHMLEVLISEDEASSGRKVKDYEYSYEEGSYGKEGICMLRVEYRSKTNHRIIYVIDKELGISMSLENMRKKKADKALSDALAVLIESVSVKS